MTIQDEITAQTLKTVKQAQDITTDAIHTVADRVTPLLPKLDTSFLNGLPKPSDVVEKAFDLGGVVLASAKNMAMEATKAFSPKIAAAPAAPAAPFAAVAPTAPIAPAAKLTAKATAKATGTKPAAKTTARTNA